MWEIYSWWSTNGYIWPWKMKKIVKQMKKSYKKADELKESSDKLKEIESIQADYFLEEQLENLND